jgi:hypothetical protein
MKPLDKLLIILIATLSVCGAPPIVQSSLTLAIYGFLCCGLGMLSMVACEGYEEAEKRASK